MYEDAIGERAVRERAQERVVIAKREGLKERRIAKIVLRSESYGRLGELQRVWWRASGAQGRSCEIFCTAIED